MSQTKNNRLSEEWTGLKRFLRSHFHMPRKGNLKLLILSFICAVSVWMYIATRVNTGIDINLTHIPVIADMTGTQAESYGLMLLTTEEELPVINANISGKRTSIGAINKDDVIAYIDFNSASDRIGQQKLPILLKTADNTPLGDYTLSLNEMTVTLDRMNTITVPVSDVLTPNLSYADGVNQDSIICEPASIDITGPTLGLEKVHHIRVTVPDSEKMFETKSFSTTDYALIDTEGNVITDSSLQPQATRFLTKISVSYSHSLPVTVDLSGVPNGFDTDFVLSRLRLNTDDEYVLPGYGDKTLSMNIKTMEYADKNALDQLDVMCIGRVPLSALSLGGQVEIPVELQDGYEDNSNLGSVYLSLDQTDLVAETRWINTKDVKPINNASNFDYQVQGGRIQVTLIGPAEQVKDISADDITASINLYNDPIEEEGTFTRSVSFTLPESANQVWVSGTYKLNLTATKAVVTTTSSSLSTNNN